MNCVTSHVCVPSRVSSVCASVRSDVRLCASELCSVSIAIGSALQKREATNIFSKTVYFQIEC